jgi:hypothetical protein
MAEQRRRHFLPTAVGALSHAEVGANAANLAFAVHAEDQSLWPALSQGSGVSGGQEPHLFGGEGAAAVCGFGMACAGAVLSTSFS